MKLQTMPLRFRVWDDVEKCWGCIPSHRIGIALDLLDGSSNEEDSRYIISQDTSLKDKNKTELYTGDIIEHRKWGIGVVQFKYGEVMAKFGIGTNVSYHNLIDSLDHIKLVGNIWQNSNLIKEKQDEETN